MWNNEINTIKISLILFHYNFFFRKYFTLFLVFISFLIMFFYLYKDITTRKIENKFFLSFYLIIITLNFVEYLSYKSIMFIIIKLWSSILIFIISIIFFYLKIIGGSDGKLCILIFLALPINILTLSRILLFYTIFLTFYIILLLGNFLINTFSSKKEAFSLLFNFYIKASWSKKIDIITSHRLVNFLDLEKRKVKYINYFDAFFFNYKKKKYQIIASYRPPLVLLSLFSFFIIIF